MKRSVFLILTALSVAALGAACDEHAPDRANENAQNAAFQQQRSDEIKPAEGVFTGKMNLNYIRPASNVRVNVSYPCTLTIQELINTKPSEDPTQPTETVSVPQLSATIDFPDLDGLSQDAYFYHDDLLDPMGRAPKINFTLGDYNPVNNWINLPYQVSSYSTVSAYGAFTGRLTGNTFRGTWSATPIGTVATFELVKK